MAELPICFECGLYGNVHLNSCSRAGIWQKFIADELADPFSEISLEYAAAQAEITVYDTIMNVLISWNNGYEEWLGEQVKEIVEAMRKRGITFLLEEED